MKDAYLTCGRAASWMGQPLGQPPLAPRRRPSSASSQEPRRRGALQLPVLWWCLLAVLAVLVLIVVVRVFSLGPDVLDDAALEHELAILVVREPAEVLLARLQILHHEATRDQALRGRLRAATVGDPCPPLDLLQGT